MRTYYRLTLLKHALCSRDARLFLRLLLKMARSAIFGQQRLVYQLMAADVKSLPSTHVDDYITKAILSSDMDNDTLRNELVGYEDYIGVYAKRPSANKKWLWVGYLKGKVAHIAWSTAGDEVSRYFFPLDPNWVLISHCVTLPQYRGLGLFRASLSYIVHTLNDKGFQRFYIDCNAWNHASTQAIQRAGFQLIGFAKHKRKGQLIFRHEPPDVSHSIASLADR
jgi:GNAT superfamily N-acetyltransferase